MAVRDNLTKYNGYLPITGGALKGSLYTQHVRSTSDITHLLGDNTHAWMGVYTKALSLYRNAVNYGDFQAAIEGTTSTKGVARLSIGNALTEGTAGNAQGYLQLYGLGARCAQIYVNSGMSRETGSTHFYLPKEAGTLMRKEDYTIDDEGYLNINLD